MDSWSDLQLDSMKAGGNEQLLKFWQDEGFPKGISSQEKYDNDAMEAYRAYIKARSKGAKASFPKQIGYTKRVRKAPVRRMNSLGSANSNARMGGMGNSQRTQKPISQDDFFAELTGSLGSMTNTLSASVGSGLTKLANKTQEIDTDQLKSSVKQGWGNFSSWATDIATKAASTIRDAANESGEELDFKSHIQRNLQKSGAKKMPSLGNTPVRRADGRVTLGTGKKMAALGSDQFFNQDQERSKTKNGAGVGRRRSTPPSAKKKKYEGMSSADFFEKDDEDKLNKFYGSENKSNKRKKKDEDSYDDFDLDDDGDLDDFGFSDKEDDDDEDEGVRQTRQVLGKISVADDDDDDIDIDDWGWDDDATKI